MRQERNTQAEETAGSNLHETENAATRNSEENNVD